MIALPRIYNFSRPQWLIISVTSLGTLMASLNTSMVNIALPAITSDFAAPLHLAEWVILIYLLLLSSLLLIYGRLGDMFGYKRVYLLGFALFTIASVLIIVSPNIYTLIGFRGLQAIGAGMIISIVQAILAATFPSEHRGKAIGINSMVVSLGLALGPSLGGLLLNFFSWKAIYFINIPIGLLGTVWARRVLPAQDKKRQHFDLPGSVVFFSSLFCLLLALSCGHNWGWLSGQVISLMTIAISLLLFFIYWERKSPLPMLKLGLFNNRLFTAPSATAILNYLVQYTISFLLPFYLTKSLHLSVSHAGLILTAFPIMLMIVSPVSGYWVDKTGSSSLTALGMGIIATAVLILSKLTPHSSLIQVLIGLCLAGIGTGLFLTPNNTAIINSVTKEEIGLGSGMIATMRSIGQAIGVALSGAILNTRQEYYLTMNPPPVNPELIFTMAQGDAFFVAAMLALLGIVTSLLGRRKNNKNTHSL